MFESIFVCYVVVRVLWYVLCFTYNKKLKKKKKKGSLHHKIKKQTIVIPAPCRLNNDNCCMNHRF